MSFKQDTAIAVVCAGLILASQEAPEDECVPIPGDEIEAQLSELADRIMTAFHKGDFQTQVWVKKKMPKFFELTNKLRGILNLELLALHILHDTFVERKKPLHPMWKFLQTEELMELAAYIEEETPVSEISADMYSQAITLAERLKCL